MADRMAAEIKIGGPLPKDKIQEFMDIIEGSGAGPEYGEGSWDPEEILDAIHREAVLDLYDDEAAWGEFPELEAFCRGVGLSFVRRSEAKYEYDAEVIWSTPLGGGGCNVSAEGVPVLDAETIRDLLKKGVTALEARLDELEPPEVPPLTIV